MITQKQLENYAILTVKVGANVQPGQEVIIRCPIECAEFGRLLAKEAYNVGAAYVWMKWSDDTIDRMNMEIPSIEQVTKYPQHLIDEAHYQVDNRVAYIFVIANNPNLYKGIDPDKIKAATVARVKAIKFSVEARSSNYCRWTIVSAPTKNWANAVFPNAKSDEEAIDLMWDAIIKSVRLDSDDPIDAWEKHISMLEKRAHFLNEHAFESIRFKSANGTDLNVGLVKDHIWLAAGEQGQDGKPFTANMPTEEVFTCPDKHNVNGIVHNALPLCYNGNTIDNFSITFKDGRIVDYTAEVGYETLKRAIETDEGSHHIGEIALIGKRSPIAEQGILFFETLYDENASCHLAIGSAYPTNIKGGTEMTAEDKDKVGVNESLTHIDFMIGTKDLDIFGVNKDGSEVRLFQDGDWVIE